MRGSPPRKMDANVALPTVVYHMALLCAFEVLPCGTRQTGWLPYRFRMNAHIYTTVLWMNERPSKGTACLNCCSRLARTACWQQGACNASKAKPIRTIGTRRPMVHVLMSWVCWLSGVGSFFCLAHPSDPPAAAAAFIEVVRSGDATRWHPRVLIF